MNSRKQINKKRASRQKRVRLSLKEVASRLRLSVFRSNRGIYAQVIDDNKGITLASASSLELKGKESKTKVAEKVGALITERAKKEGVKELAFDRGFYKYHGRIKSLLDEVRKGGIKV